MWKTGNGSFKILVTYLGEGEQGEQSVHGVCVCMHVYLPALLFSFFIQAAEHAEKSIVSMFLVSQAQQQNKSRTGIHPASEEMK